MLRLSDCVTIFDREFTVLGVTTREGGIEKKHRHLLLILQLQWKTAVCRDESSHRLSIFKTTFVNDSLCFSFPRSCVGMYRFDAQCTKLLGNIVKVKKIGGVEIVDFCSNFVDGFAWICVTTRERGNEKLSCGDENFFRF